MSQPLFECGVERNRVQRHLDVGLGGELGAHSAHALAGGTFALVRLALDDEHVAAARLGQMPGDAGAHNPAADDDDVRSLHFHFGLEGYCMPPKLPGAVTDDNIGR